MTIDLNACVGCSACVDRLPGGKQYRGGRQGPGLARPPHALDSRRPLLQRQHWTIPSCISSRCRACIARTRRASWSAPWRPRCTAAKASTRWFTTAASALAIAPTTVPYKVRRFNFLLYSDWDTQSLYPDAQSGRDGAQPRRHGKVHLLHPAHQRGEDRIRESRTAACADGEIVPACAQACPTQAIAFGDINDPKSKVAQLKAQMRNYSLLEELNTRPRTTYLGRLRNPNPEIERQA